MSSKRKRKKSDSGAVWLAHLHGVQRVGGSNPLCPTISKVNLGSWYRSERTEVIGSYAERYEHRIIMYTCYGLESDWMIEKREDTVKPYILMKICTGDRYGAFDRLGSAKIAAYLFDFG